MGWGWEVGNRWVAGRGGRAHLVGGLCVGVRKSTIGTRLDTFPEAKHAIYPLSGLFFGGSIEKNPILKMNSRAPPLHSEFCDSPRAKASGENFGNFTPKSGPLLESRGPKMDVSPSVCGREDSGNVPWRFL